MLHLMLVDDEPLAVDYLFDAIQEWKQYELTVTKAYSGLHAMDKMNDMRLDILLTDIRMPGMNGLELADRVREQWPRCKIIFLSGYNDFDYIQTAIRKGGTDYVLKTEGDELIFQAIEKAAQEITTELMEGDISLKARQQLQQALPALRRDYLLELLRGEEILWLSEQEGLLSFRSDWMPSSQYSWPWAVWMIGESMLRYRTNR